MLSLEKQEGTMKTIEWIDGQVVLIDQTKLPLEEVFIKTADYMRIAEAIKILSVRGAPAIGVAAAYGVALAAQSSKATEVDAFVREINEAVDMLGKTRPTAVNLFWALERMKKKMNDSAQLPVAGLKQALKEEADLIAQEELDMSRKIGEYGAELLEDGDRVLTHCNAGALATVDYGTALAPIRVAVEQGKKIYVVSDETRPLLQGARLTAWELMRDGIPVTMICDNMAGYMMKLGKVDKVIVGADRITANGDVANKIGTYSVAVLSKEHGIPFYVAAPVSTIDVKISEGDDIPIEERGSEEMTHIGGVRVAPEGVTVASPAFDVTPNRLVSAIITDKGVLRSPYDKSIAAIF
jgi:methylthioribose-1-phosphate isomerase